MAFNPDVPDLATMSVAALNILNQNSKGFFIMIEGGGVDWMGHANYMPRFIEEQMDFNAAVAAVIDWVETYSNWEDTLLIVTSDHETGGIWGEGTDDAASGILHPTNCRVLISVCHLLVNLALSSITTLDEIQPLGYITIKL